MKAFLLIIAVFIFTGYQIYSYYNVRTEILRGDVYQYEMYRVKMDDLDEVKYEYRKVIGVSDSIVYFVTSSDNRGYDGQESMHLTSFLIGGKRL